MAHRHHVTAADEEMRLTESDAPVDQLRGPRDDEQRLPVPLDLGILMRLAGILDGEIMQAELRLDALQQLGARLPQPDPHDVAWPLRPFARFFDGDVLDAASAGVNAGGDDAGFALGMRRSRRLSSGVHSFSGAARLLREKEYSPFAISCRLPGCAWPARARRHADINRFPSRAAFRST